MPKSYPQKLAKALRDLYENHYKGKGGWEAISQEKFRGKVSGGTLNRIAYSKKREGSQYLPRQARSQDVRGGPDLYHRIR